MCPPGRVERMACIIDSWVPTASITEWAPSPSVRSLILATPSSPRSSTMSVAPNSRASLCRGSWRLMADQVGWALEFLDRYRVSFPATRSWVPRRQISLGSGVARGRLRLAGSLRPRGHHGQDLVVHVRQELQPLRSDIHDLARERVGVVQHVAQVGDPRLHEAPSDPLVDVLEVVPEVVVALEEDLAPLPKALKVCTTVRLDQSPEQDLGLVDHDQERVDVREVPDPQQLHDLRGRSPALMQEPEVLVHRGPGH